MRQIFWGMLFLFLDFNLNLGSSSIGLIPDFAGCIFLIRGLDALAGESVRFVQARPWAVATADFLITSALMEEEYPHRIINFHKNIRERSEQL